jgi:hypothetical protein
LFHNSVCYSFFCKTLMQQFSAYSAHFIPILRSPKFFRLIFSLTIYVWNLKFCLLWTNWSYNTNHQHCGKDVFLSSSTSPNVLIVWFKHSWNVWSLYWLCGTVHCMQREGYISASLLISTDKIKQLPPCWN